MPHEAINEVAESSSGHQVDEPLHRKRHNRGKCNKMSRLLVVGFAAIRGAFGRSIDVVCRCDGHTDLP